MFQMWDLLTDGKSHKPRNAAEALAVRRFNDIILCEEFGWRPKDIDELDGGWYQDCLTIVNLRKHKAWLARNKK